MTTLRELASPFFLPCTNQFDVSAWVALENGYDMVRINLETPEPTIVFEDSSLTEGGEVGGVYVRAATQEEIDSVIAGLS
jgi:hypothetical protein